MIDTNGKSKDDVLILLHDNNTPWDDISSIMLEAFNEDATPEAWRSRYRRMTGQYKRTPYAPKPEGEKIEGKEVISWRSDGTMEDDRVIEIAETDLQNPVSVLMAHKYDPAKWELVSARHSKWDTNLKAGDCRVFYASKITVRPKTGFDLSDIEKVYSSLAPRALKREKETTYGDRMLELSLADIHLGRLSWAGTAGANYDMGIAIDRVKTTISRIVSRMGRETFDVIVVPVGGDLLNSDSSNGETTGGTPQDNDGRFPRLISKTLELMVCIVEEMRKHTKEVRVVLIPGNHDENSSFIIALGLAAWFRQTDDVRVDTVALKRKYIAWRDCLLCLGHFADDGKQLPYILPKEAKEIWSRSRFIEAHGGHTHKEQVQDYNSFVLRRSPTLASPDEWSHGKGYVTTPRHATYIWREGNGMEEIWINTL